MAEFAPFFSVLNSTKNIIVYGFELKAASQEAVRVRRRLEIVQRDLNSLRRDANEAWADLSEPQQTEVKQTISDVNEAILQMAKPITASWRNIREYGTVTLYRRIQWTLGDKATVGDCESNLQAAHASLIGVHNRLPRNDSRGVRARRHVLPEAVPRLDTIHQSTTREKRLSDGVLRNPDFWEEFMAESVEELPYPRLSITRAEDEHSGVNESHATTHNATTLSPKIAAKKRKKSRSPEADKTDLRLDKTIHEQQAPSQNASVWAEIARRDRENESRRRSTSQELPSPSNASFWSELSERSEDDRKRRRQS